MHFFTDPGSIPAGSNTQKFGPVLTGPVAGSNPNELVYSYDDKVFHVTTVFTLTATAKVYACQESMMIVQPYIDISTGTVNDDLVNIILKPTGTPDIPYMPVKYYVYRGVLKNSFISGLVITPADPGTNTEFITKFWAGWEKQKTVLALPATTPAPSPKSFGFDPSLNGTTLAEDIFNSAQSSNTDINDMQAIKVTEGEWIGNFGANNIGFEIVVDIDTIKVDLEYVRKSNYIIDVTLLANVTPVTDESKFNLRAKREEVLNYADPAAFFGMHYEAGVSGKKNELLYTDIIDKFFNKDCIYLDIRSEKGFSYNFYENYKDGSNINVKATKTFSGTTPPPIEKTYSYGINNFPLIIFRASAEFPVASYIKTALDLQLRIDDNKVPLLFFENIKLLKSKVASQFLNDKALVNTTPSDWTKKIPLLLPAVTIGTQKINLPIIAKIQYFRQKENTASPDTVFKNTNYLDAVWGGINMPSINVPTVFHHAKNTKRGFVKGSNFSYVAETGAYIDPDQVILYASCFQSFKKSKHTYPKVNFSGLRFSTLGSQSPVLPKDIVYNRWVADETTTAQVNILEIAGYNNADEKRETNIENIYFLGLTRTEFDALKNLAGDISPRHLRYIAFEEIPNQQDVNNGMVYKKYKLTVRGLDKNGKVKTLSPSPEIFVYGSGLNMLNTKGFSAATDLPNQLPDPGTMVEWPLVEKWVYDDTTPVVTSLFTAGEVKVDDFASDLSVTKPKVKLKGNVFYPVDAMGDTDPNMSNATSKFPLAVVIHGNGQRYTEYETLCTHLARNGIIAMSISCLAEHNEFTLEDLDPPHILYLGITYDKRFQIDDSFLYSTASKKVLKVNSPTSLTPMTWTHGTEFTVTGDKIKFTFMQSAQGVGALVRANLLYPHLQIIKKRFGAKLDNKIGVMGHSRGGEAVLINANTIGTLASGSTFPTTPNPRWVHNDLKKIKAVFSLAPTDQYQKQTLTGGSSDKPPYFVLYGSRDADITGIIPSKGANLSPRLRASPITITSTPYTYPVEYRGSGGFSLWDRAANDSHKSMIFVHGASHNGFITVNDEKAVAPIPESDQKSIIAAYLNAFFRMTLKDEQIWKGIFEDNSIPVSVQKKKLYHQHRKTAASDIKIINNFNGSTVGSISLSGSIAKTEGDLNLTQMTVSGIVAPPIPPGTITVTSVTDNNAARIDKQSPHFTKGLRVTVNTPPASGTATANTLTFNIAASGLDASPYKCLSFRIGHSVKITSVLSSTTSPVTLAPFIDFSQIKVKLADISGISYDVLLSAIKVPEPDIRPEVFSDTGAAAGSTIYFNATKSALMTIRIPLSDYSNQNVNITQIKTLSFIFPAVTSEVAVILDDIEFSN